MDDLYGRYGAALQPIAEETAARIQAIGEEERARTGHSVIEHVSLRVKTEESMRAKLRRMGLAETTENALRGAHDSVGLRVVTRFIDDIGLLADRFRHMPGATVFREKDYVRQAKPNGYRSFHMVLEMPFEYHDVLGRAPGLWFVEIQLRTIAMDTWASLEHELKYKQNVANERLIEQELKRVADELASCDVSMQTLRNLIRGQEGTGR